MASLPGISSTLNCWPSGPELDCAVQAPQPSPSIPTGSSITPSTDTNCETTSLPFNEERISEAAGVNSASGSFGLSFGLAVAGGVLLATLSLAFTNMTNASPEIPSAQQQQIAQTLEDDAQVVSNTELDELLADEPPAVRQEILDINTDATNLALQVALLLPILAGLLGLLNSFRMIRLRTLSPPPPSKQRPWADRAPLRGAFGPGRG